MEERSLPDTPSWAVATVLTVILAAGLLFHILLEQIGKWMDRTKRKALLAALEKIKEELMMFGLLSLLMGHWTVVVAKICVKSSELSSTFYPCSLPKAANHFTAASSNYLNHSRLLLDMKKNGFCPKGKESFASYESLEQLHRFLFVLGMTHVTYSFVAIALGMIKLYSWKAWENQTGSMGFQGLQDSQEAAPETRKLSQLGAFLLHRISHPWSQHRVLVWLLCFFRQFWSSINQADYMALRFGFISTHQLPESYDFHKYMLRSMEEEFRDIVGISMPLWIFGILCIMLDFHGTNIYFWLSFLPAILVLLIGTKLHRVVVKLAVEIVDGSTWTGQFKLRDGLFWFGKPILVLRLIQFISFQNAFEMATYLWSLWEIKEASCFTVNHTFLWIRLTFGLLTQFWCSFITFPLYVIVTQMGSSFRKAIVSEDVRKSLHGWQRRVRTRREHPSLKSSTSSDFELDNIHQTDTISSANMKQIQYHNEDRVIQTQDASSYEDSKGNGECPGDDKGEFLPFSTPCCEIYDCCNGDERDGIHVRKDSSSLVHPH